MSDPVPLRVVPAEPEGADPSVAETLDEVTALAVEGGLAAVAVIMVYRDGTVANCWSARGDLQLFLAGASRLAHELNQRLDDDD